MYKHRKRIGLLHICDSTASCRRNQIFIVTLLEKTVTCSIIGFSVRKLDVVKLTRTLDNEDMLPQEANVEDDYYYRNGLYFTSYDLKVLQRSEERSCRERV